VRPPSPGEFTALGRLLHAEAGILLRPGKEALVTARLGARLERRGYRTYADYLAYLDGPTCDREQEVIGLLDAMTTNTTEFFRENRHFEVLRKELPRLSREASAEGRPLRVWSSACSTGQEPYTIAMVLLETLGENANFRVLASDIDTQALSEASRGEYSPGDLAGVPRELRERYFAGAGERQRVKPSVRSRVVFRRINLMRDELRFKEKVDVVFCRNVLIYFDEAGRERVLRRLAEVLRPRGMMFIGHSESLLRARSLFDFVEGTVYLRKGGSEGQRP
jgi:chemotaxis protein methyltransferase CheR